MLAENWAPLAGSLEIGSHQIVDQIEHEYPDQDLGQKQISFLRFGEFELNWIHNVQEQIAAVGPHEFLAVKLIAMDQVFVGIQHRVVDVGLALIAPYREIAEAQRQRMFRLETVQHRVFVDISATVNPETVQTYPILRG